MIRKLLVGLALLVPALAHGEIKNTADSTSVSLIRTAPESPAPATLEECQARKKALIQADGTARGEGEASYDCTVTYRTTVQFASCGPAPAQETRPMVCPEGKVGSWTQTISHVRMEYPTCWVASAWIPASAPADKCVTPYTGANPFGVAFANTTNVSMYAKPGGLVVAGRCLSHSSTPEMQAVRAGGGEVLQYIIPSEVNDTLQYCSYGRDQTYYTSYGKPVPLWPYPKSAPGTRSKWPKTKMTDMRPGSPWILHTVAYIEKLMVSKTVDGVFLDTVGAQSYAPSAEWKTWSAEEKDAYTLGNIDLVKRLRASANRLNPGFILVSNTVWHREDGDKKGFEGEKYVNGVTIEHQLNTSAWHRNYAAKPFGVPTKRRVLVIGMSQDDAKAWAKVSGVTHVSGQSSSQYTNPLPPPVPFRGD